MGFVKSVLSMKKPKNSLKIGDWHEIDDLFCIMHAGARAQKCHLLYFGEDNIESKIVTFYSKRFGSKPLIISFG